MERRISFYTSAIKDSGPHVTCEAAYAISYSNDFEKGIERFVYPFKEEDRKIGYPLLEYLSLDPNMKHLIQNYNKELKNKFESLPCKKNKDAGLIVRGILVNLGCIDVKDIYTLISMNKV